MSRYITLIIMVFFFVHANGQDTLYIDITTALKMAEENNLLYQNARLKEMQINKNSYSANRNLTELTYEYGKLYSPENAWKLEVNQQFGNILQNYRRREQNELLLLIEENKNQLQLKALDIQIKSVYLEWIFTFNLLENYKMLMEYESARHFISKIRADLGETEPLEDLKAKWQISELETKIMECKFDIEIIGNELRKLLITNSYLIPSSKKLDMYMVEKKYDTSRYNGNYFTDINLLEYKYSTSNIKVKKAGYSPSLSAGLFIQNIGNYSNAAGIKAGISIPVWFIPNKSEVNKLKIQSEIDYNNYVQSANNSRIDIENLLLELNKHFLKIRHYQNYAVPSANLQIRTAVVKYNNEDIEYPVYIQEIEEAFDVKREYLTELNQYNQTALKLELYTK